MFFADREFLIITLQDAFTRYITLLQQCKATHEESLPRQGKGIETTSDLKIEQQFEARIATAEVCLGYVAHIAREVQGWMVRDIDGDQSTDNEYPGRLQSYEGDKAIVGLVRQDDPVASFEKFQSFMDDEPFVDLLGKLHQPITPFSAGPSNNYGKSLAQGCAKDAHKVGSPDTTIATPSETLSTTTLVAEGEISKSDAHNYKPGTQGGRGDFPNFQNQGISTLQATHHPTARLEANHRRSSTQFATENPFHDLFSQDPFEHQSTASSNPDPKTPSTPRPSSISALHPENSNGLSLGDRDVVAFAKADEARAEQIMADLRAAFEGQKQWAIELPWAQPLTGEASVGDGEISTGASTHLPDPQHSTPGPFSPSTRVSSERPPDHISLKISAPIVGHTQTQGSSEQSHSTLHLQSGTVSPSAGMSQLDLDILTAQRLQAEWEEEERILTGYERDDGEGTLQPQADLARQLYEEENQRAAAVEQALAEAQRMADLWESEDLMGIVETKNKNYTQEGYSPAQAPGNFARQLQTEEAQRAQEVNRALEEAKKLAEQWAEATELTNFSRAQAIALWEQWDDEDQTLVEDFESSRAQAERLQKKWEEEDNRLISELRRNEELRAQRIKADMEVAKAVQEQWIGEAVDQEKQARQIAEKLAQAEADAIREQELATQRVFAQELVKADEARAARIKADMEVASRAQQQWEADAQAQDQAQRVAEEIARADAEAARAEASRAAEQERLARLERERLQREQDDRRRQQIAAERVEAEKRARQVNCASCMETGERADMAELPCRHWYCGECLNGCFRNALSSRIPFACCKVAAPIALASRFMPMNFITEYNTFLLELSTKKPIYCSNRACNKFIPPQNVHGPLGICPLCGQRTCASCSNPEHAGVCAEDKEGAAALKLAGKKGWKPCPSCRQICDKMSGCLHITCRCRAEWCYNCLRDWSVCGSRCAR